MAKEDAFDIGMIGLGVMGRNLALNMADHGCRVAGYDPKAETAASFAAAGSGGNLAVAGSLAELAGMLRRPRAVVMLVPAGKAVDAVIDDLSPHLEGGDVLIDAGNSHYRDTDRRGEAAAARGLHYLGVGVSGGEEGARHGPSIMAGGPREAYDRVGETFQAVAARAGGEPCAAWLGPRSAGHYVKMVHNGIEYGLMQLIAETYDFMKRSLGFDNDRIHAVYAEWSTRSKTTGYLLEITADIFLREDEPTGGRLIDVVLDEAEQKGTGLWTSETALELGVPAPTIDLAVSMRDMSAYKNQRRQESALLHGPRIRHEGDAAAAVRDLERALSAAMVITYAQGFALLGRASAAMGYGLNLATVAGIWRGGCIIRSAMLEDIHRAFQRRADLVDLLLEPSLAARVQALQHHLRRVVTMSACLGLPMPCMAASLGWLDSCRSEWLPANLIQAQRDCFGSHKYRRTDREGTFHTDWRREEVPA